MAEGERPAYCGQCGNVLEQGDSFCGNCGAAVLPPSPQAEQVIPRQVAASQATPRGSSRPVLLASVLGAVAVLVIGGGALALVGSGLGGGLLGASEAPQSEERGNVSSEPEPAPSQELTAEDSEGYGGAEPTSAPPLPVTTLPESTTSADTSASPANLETEAEEAAGEYYRAAGVEDWSYTYDNLDGRTLDQFTREEWFKKNQWLADNGDVIYNIASASMVDGAQERLASVTVTLTYEDGSSSARETFFVYEYGEWKHRFGEEENDLFMPDANFEEFVEGQS